MKKVFISVRVTLRRAQSAQTFCISGRRGMRCVNQASVESSTYLTGDAIPDL